MAVTISPSGTLDYAGSSPFGGGPGLPTTNTHLITGSNVATTQSTGTPQVLNTPQSDYSLAFAREAQNAGQNLYGWAGKQYKYLQGLAGTAIPQFLQAGANASAMGNQQFSQYMNTYAPAMERFNETANSYASAGRQAYEAGAAEADATQAAHSSWMDTLNNLRSYGIDPSSGLYAGIKSAADTAAGASAAGAGNQAMRDVQKTGLGLQEQNINFGQSLPASALNAVNAQNTALSGAVNTGESTVNTGANAYSNANNFFQTAQQLKLPVSGQGTQSSSASVGDTGQPVANVHTGTYSEKGGLIEPDDGYRRGGRVRHGGHGMGGRGGGGGATGKPRVSGSFGRTGFSTVDSDAEIRQNARSGGTGFNTVDSDAEIRARTGGGQSPSPPGQGGMDDTSGGGGHRGGGGSGGGRRHRGGGQQQQQPQQNSDNSDNGGIPNGLISANGPPSLANGPPSLANGPPSLANGPPSLANGLPDDNMGAAQGGSMDPKMAQPPGHFGRPHPPHPYHMNGLPDASTGGHVPYELSPSHGHTTDDVVANLNAGEFVLPRRTVHHVGHKFLYDLIGKSDKEMGLHPQPVGPSKVAPNSGAGKARQAAESQNFSSGGLPA